MTPDGISFLALLVKAQTTVDGGWRVTLDIAQDQAEEILKLSQYREELLQVAVIPLNGVRSK